LVSKSPVMDTTSVRDAYRRWAPIYDLTFGKIAEAGRKNAVQIINRRRGRVLEVGVGTGLSLPCYGSHLTITGIDLSPEMLAKAEDKVDRHNLANVAGLHEMDAGALAFPDESFDTVVAMYVMTVVPVPQRVMRELERVCAAGGEVILSARTRACVASSSGSLPPLPISLAGVPCSTSTRCSCARICGLPSGGH